MKREGCVHEMRFFRHGLHGLHRLRAGRAWLAQNKSVRNLCNPRLRMKEDNRL